MSPQLLGITLKVSSTVAFTVMVTLIKIVADRVPPGEVLFARAFFGTVPVLAMILWRRELKVALRTAHPFGHMKRAIVGTISMFSWFASITYLPLADATAINYAGPLFGVLFAALLLGEKVRIYRWSAVAVGFIGVLIVLSEQMSGGFGSMLSDDRAIGGLLALNSAVFAALAMVTVRELTATESTSAIVFYFSASAALLSLVTIPFGWVVPSAGDAAILVLAGLFGGVGQVLMTQAYRHAEASVIAPYDYANMLWIVIVAFVVFGTLPTMPVVIGSLIVIAAGAFVIWRERQIGLLESRRAERKAASPT